MVNGVLTVGVVCLRRARWVRAGALPRALPLAPAAQRRGRLYLRGAGHDLRRAPGAPGHRRVGEYQAADETVEQEANAAAEIFWLGNRLRGEPAVSSQPQRPKNSSTRKDST